MKLVAVVIALALAGCYSPNVERCRVTCEDSDRCPGAQICLDDNFCHEPSDTASCTPDATPPPIDAEPDAEIADAGPDAEPPDAMPPLGITAISTGGDHACAIDALSRLWCWGANRLGQLGIDSAEVRVATPTRVGTAADWTAISAGEQHTCGIRGTALYCWGSNETGEIGVTTPSVVSTPTVPSGAGGGWIAISAGARFTCGIRDDSGARHVYCWGQNSYGELGNGTETSALGTIYATVADSDGAVHGDWKAISAGSVHACGIRDAGETYCWGQNAVSQLGIGVAGGSRNAPTRVVADVEDAQNAYVAVAAGYLATCGIATNGLLYCWGNNTYRQLASSSYGTEPVPRRASTLPGWSTISLSNLHACGSHDGGVACWGLGSRGAIGDGAWLDRSTPTPVTGLDVEMPMDLGYESACAAPPGGGVVCWGDNPEGELGNGETSTKHVPTAVAPSDGQWTKVGAGYRHTCAVHAGEVRCWGDNSVGTLGTDLGAGWTTPQPVGGLGTGTPVELAVAAWHTCAILDPGGDPRVWCWGHNTDGQIGIGSLGAVRSPTQIGAAAAWHGLAVTAEVTCALIGTGRVCWGSGSDYARGDNQTGQVLTPAAITEAHTWAQHTLGFRFGCGIKATTGRLACWGTDNRGEQGDGPTVTTAMAPHEIDTGVTYDRVHAWDSDGACAIRSDGDLACWGRNEYGQTGRPTSGSADVDVPTVVPGAGDWTDLAVAYLTVCGIKNDGEVGELYCWGSDFHNQLGVDEDVSLSSAPQRVGADAGWTQVSTGIEHTCALRGGNLYCWGDNLYGQIGDGTRAHNTPQPVDLPAL